MKTLLAYSSKTGNTKKFCEAVFNNIKDNADIEIYTVKQAPAIDEYDLVIVGYWVDKGTANTEARKFIESIKNKKVALLGTLGAAPDSEHGKKTIVKVGKLVDSSNEFLGIRLARGKVTEKLTKAIKLLPLPKHIKEQMYESSVNSREPNEEEISNATEFIKTALGV
ncbi:MAG: flavodoxin [Treponema sp.]|nr:MAG: flavodoxin [Treponema sp.]